MNPSLLERVCAIWAYLAVSVLAHAVKPVEPYRATIAQDGVQRVLGGEYFFKPRRIIVKANIPVELLARREAGLVPTT